MPHIDSETNTRLPTILSFVIIWDSLLAQISVLLLFQYAAILSEGKRTDLFLKNGPLQIFRRFFQELTWLQLFVREIVTKFEEVR